MNRVQKNNNNPTLDAKIFLLVLLVFCLCFAQSILKPAVAQSSTDLQTTEFSIPGGPLVNVLEQFALQTGVNLSYSTKQIAGKSATGLAGVFTLEAGLRTILSGTGLRAVAEGGGYRIVIATENSDPLTLEPVEVTGELASRRLFDTTISVSVLSQNELERKDSERIYDSIRGLPNVTPTPPDFLPAIRGVPSGGPLGIGGSFFAASEPRARLIVDDVARPQTFANNSFQSIFDAQQVELLRGPQTTLRGNNTIAGAYVVKTNDPIFGSEASLQAGLDYNEISETGYRVSAMGNTVLIDDELAARFVVDHVDGKVPVEVYDDGSAIPAGTDLEALSEYDNLYFRGKFLYEPQSNPDLSGLLILELEEGRDIGFDSFIWGRDSTIFAPDGIEQDPEDRLYGFGGGQPVFDTETRSTIADLRYALAEDAEFRSITAVSNSDFSETFQFNPVFGFENMIRDRMTQDFIYSADLETGLDLVLGFNYTSEDAENTVGPTVGTEEERRSTAVFADLTYHLRDNLRLLGGGRYLRNSVEFEGTVFLPVDFDQRETEFLPKLGVAYDIDENQTVSAVARRGFNPGGSSVDFNSFEVYEYDAEFVRTYELGYRGLFRNETVQINATIFSNEYEDYQFEFSPDPFTSRVFNFDGNSHGLELEVRARVSETITLGGALGLLETEVEASGESVDGNEFGEDPDMTLSANILWQARPDFSVDFAANFVDEYFTDFNNNDGTEAGDYVNIDAGVTYDPGSYVLRGYIRNLTDEFAYHSRNTANDDGSGYVLPPREIGVTLTVPF
ncbi:MAG: TonB-dependent receptor [Pseudomonadota bacterium]